MPYYPGWPDVDPPTEHDEYTGVIFIGKQIHSSVMSGDYGVESWHDEARRIYKGGLSSMGGPTIWGILGRPLGNGARVRITVEVLDEGEPVIDKNPWRKD